MALNVLFVDLGPAYGGAQRSLLSLIKQLPGHGVQPVLLGADQSGKGLVAKCRALGIPCETVPNCDWRKSLVGAGHVAKDLLHLRPILRGLLREHNIDVVYANGINAGLAARACLQRKTPLLFHHRDFKCPTEVFRSVANRADATLVVSTFIRNHVGTLLREQILAKVKVVHNGFDLDELASLRAATEPEHEEWLADSPQPRAVILADMVPWKRHDLFLRGLALAQRREMVSAMLVGGPRNDEGQQYEGSLKTMAATLPMADRVTFTGWVANPHPLLAASDVMVFPSESEPFGRAVVEALAAGIPVLTTTTSGGPQEIGEGCEAVTVVGDTPDAIAEGLLSVLQAPNKTALAEAAKAKAAQFSMARYVTSVLDVIKQISS